MTDSSATVRPPPPPPLPRSPAPSTPQSRALMIVLAYLWIMALVPLLLEKDDVEIQWHAKHGLVLVTAEVIVWIAGVVAFLAVNVAMGVFGCLLGVFASALSSLFLIGVLIMHIACIVKGLRGERFLVPGVSEYTSRF